MKRLAVLAWLALVAAAEPTPPRVCGDWSRAPREDFSNRALPNFGCADAANLAAQLADPADLVRGRGTARQAGEAAARAVERYRTDTATPLAGSTSPAATAAPATPE